MHSFLCQCLFFNKEGQLNWSLILQLLGVLIGAAGLVITVIKLVGHFSRDKLHLNAQYESGNQVYISISTRSQISFTIESIFYRGEKLPIVFPYVLTFNNPISITIPDQGLFSELMEGNSKVIIYIKVSHRKKLVKKVERFKEIAPDTLLKKAKKIIKQIFN